MIPLCVKGARAIGVFLLLRRDRSRPTKGTIERDRETVKRTRVDCRETAET